MWTQIGLLITNAFTIQISKVERDENNRISRINGVRVTRHYQFSAKQVRRYLYPSISNAHSRFFTPIPAGSNEQDRLSRFEPSGDEEDSLTILSGLSHSASPLCCHLVMGPQRSAANNWQSFGGWSMGYCLSDPVVTNGWRLVSNWNATNFTNWTLNGPARLANFISISTSISNIILFKDH